MGLDPSPYKNLTELFLARLKANPEAPAFSYFLPSNHKKKNKEGKRSQPKRSLKTLTWQDYGDRVRGIAAGLLSLGFKKGHRFLLYDPQSLPAYLLEMAVLSIGGVSIPISRNIPLEKISSLIKDYQIAFLFIQDQETWEEVLRMFHKLPDLQRIITAETIRGDAEIQLDINELQERGIQGLKRAQMHGTNAAEGDLLEHAKGNIENERDAFLYYYEDMDHEPHPIPITHQQVLAQCKQIYQAFTESFVEGEKALNLISPAHILGRVQWFFQLLFGTHVILPGENPDILKTLQDTSPGLIFTHPHQLETIHKLLALQINDLSGLTGKLAKKLSLKEKTEKNSFRGSGLRGLLTDHLVFPKIREILGGKVHTILSSDSPLPISLGKFFAEIGIKIFDMYTKPEMCGVITTSRGTPEELGTVGKPLSQCEVKVTSAGEILVHGASVFKGYGASYGEIQEDGRLHFEGDWFHTGDLGGFDEENRLMIYGKKSNLIINSAGKQIFPEKIESRFANNPLFNQIIVCGTNRPYIVALVDLNEHVLNTLEEFKSLTQEENWHQNENLREMVRREIETVNQDFEAFEQIRDFAILSQPKKDEKGEIILHKNAGHPKIWGAYEEVIRSIYPEEY